MVRFDSAVARCGCFDRSSWKSFLLLGFDFVESGAPWPGLEPGLGPGLCGASISELALIYSELVSAHSELMFGVDRVCVGLFLAYLHSFGSIEIRSGSRSADNCFWCSEFGST